MKKQILKSSFALVAGLGLTFGISSTSYAFTFNAANVTDGNHTYSTTGGTVTADSNYNDNISTGTFQKKSGSNFTAVGVTGGVAGEIDTYESITFAFTQAQIIDSFTIAFLYADKNAGDQVNEFSLVFADGAVKDYTLKLTADDYQYGGTPYYSYSIKDSSNNTVNFGGSVQVLSKPLDNYEGVFQFNNIFGTTAINSLTFKTGNDFQGTQGSDTDYSIVSVNAHNAVPEPTTMLLFGAGTLGLSAFARRRK